MPNPERKQKRVDIIILNYNGRDDTIECLESLREIDYQAHRITLIDNGSIDGTAEAVAELFPQVNLIRSEENLRFAGGNNLAFEKTLEEGFDYALMLNNDTVVESDFLTEMVETAESNPEIGLVGAKMYYYDHPNVIWFAGGRANIFLARMRHIGIGETDRGQYEEPKEMDFLNGACLLVRCEVLKDIGLLDEDFFLYGEDFDLCLRAVKKGYKLYYQPRARIRHKVSRSTPHLKKLLYRYQSWIRLIRKHTPFYWWPLQYANLVCEFIPLVTGFIYRKIRFSRVGK